jgi:monofunctional biosynthetic peptidoglycan transglycosylase
LRWLIIVTVLGLIIADCVHLRGKNPGWETLSAGPCPKSLFIREYEVRAKTSSELPPLAWQPVSLEIIPDVVQRAVIAAEDAHFRQHIGVDFEALKGALSSSSEHGEADRGAGTISQQTIKNMVLGGESGLLHTWHEMLLALWMERALSKDRILFLYLNVAELGPGTYGVEAAARNYWQVPAAELTYDQAVQLAATLPNPRFDNPATKTEHFNQRVIEIDGIMKQLGWAPRAEEKKTSEGSSTTEDAARPPGGDGTSNEPSEAAAESPAAAPSTAHPPVKGKRAKGKRRRRPLR